jgi:hypothetical protein
MSTDLLNLYAGTRLKGAERGRGYPQKFGHKWESKRLRSISAQATRAVTSSHVSPAGNGHMAPRRILPQAAILRQWN